MTDEQQMHSESAQAEQAAPALDFAPMSTPESPVVVDPAAPVNMLASNTGEHGPSAVPLPGSSAELDDATVEQGLARLEPVDGAAAHLQPRAVRGVRVDDGGHGGGRLVAGGVHPEDGQAYDDMVWSHLVERLPNWLDPVVGVFTVSLVVQIISAVLAVGAVIVAIVRKRWWLLGQSAVFAVLCLASSLLKEHLPRPFIIHVEAPEANSAPSGHTILAAAAGIALLCVVPRAWRALTGRDRRRVRAAGRSLGGGREVAPPDGCGDGVVHCGGDGDADAGVHPDLRHGRAG